MFNLFNLSLRINGFPIKKASLELEKIQAIPEKYFENHVIEKRIEIVNYHLKNNSNYSEFVGKSSFDN